MHRGSIAGLVLLLTVAGNAFFAPARAMHPRAGISAVPRVAASVPQTARQERARWKHRIDSIIGDRPVGVALFDDGSHLYSHLERAGRIPASAEKLLLSMALMSELGPRAGLSTLAVAGATDSGVVRGDLWLLGSGDPSVSGGGRYGKHLPFTPTRLGKLARKIASAGVTRIEGSVIGHAGYFEHDWFAEGWKSDFPAEEIPLPSALSVDGNTDGGKHISDPEMRAARLLTKRLRAAGVRVADPPAVGIAPDTAATIVAQVSSRPVRVLLGYTNRYSSNFFAEMLGKRLAVEVYGEPGTIAAGAEAIAAWAAAHAVAVEAHDSSGLSYANRVSAQGLALLLGAAEQTPWGAALRKTLAAPGTGTLEHRLAGVRVRAKTGTLDEISALAGYVWLERSETWAEFAILSGGLPKSTAVDIEDRVVRLISRRAR